MARKNQVLRRVWAPQKQNIMPKPTRAAELLVRCRVVLCKFCDLSRAAPTHRVSSSNAYTSPLQTRLSRRATWNELGSPCPPSSTSRSGPRFFVTAKMFALLIFFRRFALPTIRGVLWRRCDLILFTRSPLGCMPSRHFPHRLLLARIC